MGYNHEIFEPITNEIRDNKHTIVADAVIFGSWERREISTKKALSEFLKNHPEITNEISEELFERYMNTFGYIRGLPFINFKTQLEAKLYYEAYWEDKIRNDKVYQDLLKEIK